MELALEQTVTEYLKKAMGQIQNQEETLETVIPDSMPDAERILGCWGVPVIRSRELRSGGMTLNGGVETRVLYAPPEEDEPRLLEVYLPFTMKWDCPMESEDGIMRHDCRVRGIDARILNSRKILVRVNLTAKGELFQSTREESFMLREKPEELEVLQEEYPVLLPVEAAEKSFLLDEDLDLPVTCPEVGSVVRYAMQTELTDRKVMGGKGVFKGIVLLHVLYLTTEGKLCTWDFDVPFSQYVELANSYEEEEDLDVTMMLSALEVASSEEPRRLRLRASMIAQCMVCARKSISLLKDAYSLTRQVDAELRDMALFSRLDRQIVRRQGEAVFPIGNGTVIDGAMYPEFPAVRRSGDCAKLELPFAAHILYMDEEGKLQGRSASGTADWETALAENAALEADCQPDGRLQWSVGGGSCTLRVGLTLQADSLGGTQVPAICGLRMGEELTKNSQRPSVVICKPSQDGGLWEMAKTFGSTVAAIQSANGLSEGAAGSEQLLLVPVL